MKDHTDVHPSKLSEDFNTSMRLLFVEIGARHVADVGHGEHLMGDHLEVWMIKKHDTSQGKESPPEDKYDWMAPLVLLSEAQDFTLYVTYSKSIIESANCCNILLLS